MGVAGRRRLVAQPGGLTLAFALHIVINLFCDRFFLPRNDMLARYMPRPCVRLCPSLSVCVCHKSEFYWNGWIDQDGCWHGNFFWPIPHCLIKNFGYLQNMVLFSGTLQSVLYGNASNKMRTNTTTNLNTVIFGDLLEFDLLQVSAVFYWCNCWPKTSSNMIFRLCLSYCVRCG